MSRVLVWDLWVRAFHWLLAVAVAATFAIALGTDDDGAVFTGHMVLGLAAAGLVVLRVVWGFVGTRWARFSSFLFGPGAAARYLRSAFSRDPGARYVGHNPGSSVAIFASLLLVLGLGLTGLLMPRGSHAAEEVHEVLAYTLLGVVGVHLLGVAWHWLRRGENLTRSMVDGRKAALPEEAIPSSRPVAAAVLVALSAVWAGSLVAGHDASARTLTFPLVGTTITLGEGGPEAGGGHHDRNDEHRGEHRD